MSSKSKTKQQTTEKVDPWAPAMPYLTEALGNASGIFKKYQNMTPDQTEALQQGQQAVRDRQNSGIYGQMQTAASGLLGGQFAPDVQKVGPVQRPAAAGGMTGPSGPANPGVVPGQNLSLPQGGGMFGRMGAANMNAPQPANANAPAAAPRPATATSGPAAPQAMARPDASGAVSRVLSGQVDNPQLAAMADAATRQGQRTYQDAVQDSADSFTRTIDPSIRSGAQLSGQYGGNRQGIAQGLALAEREKQLGRAARDLGIASTDATAGLYGRAYESAQDRMAGLADSVDARNLQDNQFGRSMAEQGRQFDASFGEGQRQFDSTFGEGQRQFDNTQGQQQRQFDASLGEDRRQFDVNTGENRRQFDSSLGEDQRQFDANLGEGRRQFDSSLGLDYDRLNTDIGFQNNDQEMRRAAMETGQLSQGAGLFGQLGELQDADFAQIMQYLGYPAEWEMGLLSPTTSAITGIGGLGRQSSGTSTGSTRSSDPMGTVSNLAMAAAMAFSDERLKTDIETLGYDSRGRRQVAFSYVWEPGVTRTGYIAQEVAKTDPHAVHRHDSGFLMIDYGKLEGIA